MRYYLDCEFYEDGVAIDLISIALVAEDGRELYAVSTDAQLHRVSPWLREHVLPSLPPYSNRAWMSRIQIRNELMLFTGVAPPGYPVGPGDIANPPFKYLDHPDKQMEVWGYYADYDHVAVCQLFGTMMQLPPHWPRFCRDLKQLSVDLGSPRHPPDPVGEHNALIDARWNRDLHAFLLARQKELRP